MSYEYVENFKKLTFGMFNHFGLYSVLAKGEWAEYTLGIEREKYESTINKFKVNKDWAKKLVKNAKAAGAKYITITTRHHDGFSLYDTRGLSDFDAIHSPCKRDLIAEFVAECRKNEIVPFFYHTLIDWHNDDYVNDFPKYLDYLAASIELLCKNYGKIGGFWFDGTWDRPSADWQEDRLYGIIRKYQPEAVIINNTGLSETGKLGHKELDSVTFERGVPNTVTSPLRPIAGEVCEALNNHWGYTENDIALKTPKEMIDLLLDCKKHGCNLLLNAGLTGKGLVTPVDEFVFSSVGKWIKANKGFIYDVKSSDTTADGGETFTDGEYLYVVVKDLPMKGDINAVRQGEKTVITLNTDKKIVEAKWLDDGSDVKLCSDNSFRATAFFYGNYLYARVAKIKLG